MDKKQIAAILDEIGTLLELQGANPFRARAYHRAARGVEGLTDDPAALVATGKILTIDGIGKGTAQVIGELVTTGVSQEYEELRRSFPPGVLDLLRIEGLGPKKVKVLYETLRVTGVDDLEQAARSNRLETIAGFGRKSAENILRGIEALRRRSDRHLYPDAEELAVLLLDALKRRKEILRAEVAGSLRRRREVVGDIDIVASARESHREQLMDLFTTHPAVQSVAARGATKSSVILKAGIRADLRIVDDRAYPFALQYFTGSKEHNVALRSRARRQGWSLNEYGFSVLEGEGRAARPPRCRDEEAIYAALDLPSIPPELREDRGEFEASGPLPHLIVPENLRGTFHCHTRASDGLNTLEEMAAAARLAGWEYLGIADHSRSAAYAGGLTEERLRAQWREIDRFNAEAGDFRVFRGTECDILADGSLDWPDRVLAECDYVVVSVHGGFRMPEAEMTRRVIRALKHKQVTMLGHPTGRLLLEREPYAIDMPAVIQAAADYGKIIEINANPRRLDLDWRLCRLAKERGVMIAINPDAHSTQGLADVRFGVNVARKGWLERRHVLNAQHRPAVEEYLSIS